MALNTDFNVSPYYDDYNEEKNFHRVLFRPAVPIQARELTQLQTILQNQVERFGDNIYKQGTIIKGCGLTFDFNYTYVKINDLQVDGQSTLVSNYANGYVENLPANNQHVRLKSEIVNYVQGLESQNPDLSTLFVKYTNTGTGGKKTYSNGDVLIVYARDYSIQSITIDAGGNLYNNTDVVVFSGGGGTGASANIVTTSQGVIRDVVINDGGSGYTSSPNVTITTTTGSSGALSALNYIARVQVANSSYTAPVGTGCAVTVGDGIIYQKGHFVRVEQQTSIIAKYTNQPDGLSAGFSTSESIVNNSVDSTLLDNAQGYSNYTAPGAHRLKLTPSLIVIPTANAASNNQFLSILEFENGRITRRRTNTEFNSVGAELARRTLEESGNYVVNPFNIYTEEKVSNTTHLNLSVSSGLGYVNGVRTELSSTIRVPVRKGNDPETSNNQTISTNYGNYVLVNQVLGNFDFSAGATVNLRNAVNTDVADNFGGAPNSAGSIIGTASVRSFVYDSGSIGTPSCQYRLYLFNVAMQSGKTFANVRSVQISGGVADTVLENANTVSVLKETSYDQLIFNSGASAVQLFNNEQFIYRKVSSVNILTTGIATVPLNAANEEFPYTFSSTLNDTQEKEFIVIPTANAHSTANLSGTVSSSGNVITGTTTSFITELSVGDYVKFSGNTIYFRVSSITNDTLMTVVSTIDSTTGPVVSGNTLSYAFPKNVPIRLDRGTANVSIDSNGNNASVFIGSTINGSTSATIYSNVKVDGADPKLKSATKDVYVKISTAKVSANTNGPWCIGIPDAFKIVGVYIGSSNTYSNTTTNYASSFELITGQNDNYYGLSYIRKKPGSTVSVTATNNLLVRVNVFTHGSNYYLSAESYPVDDATTPLPSNKIRTEDIPYYLSPKSGKYYNLRDTIDFRPIVANTANVSTTVAGATTDPLATEALTGTLYFPTPNEAFEADITYYLRRIDTIVIDSAGSVRVVEGVPDTNPVPPRATDGTMKLGTIFVPPYPSLSPKSATDSQRHEYSTLIKQDQVKGYTMKDIKQIEDRIDRIEYYSLLNTLEKNTTDLIIPSESNTAISRFKNGFFAESFSSYDISNVNDPEYNIFIDTRSTVARPQIEKHVINLVANTTASSNVTFKGEYALIDYTDSVLLSQPIANKVRNPTQLMWKFRGSAEIYPKYDNYYDVKKGSVNVTIDLATPLNALAKSINDNVTFKSDSQQISTSSSAYSTVTAATRQAQGLEQRTNTTITNTTKGSISSSGTTLNNQQVGEFVTDFGMNPYIRAQWITFNVVGLRPNTIHYVFFDKVDITNYARPGEFDNLQNMDPRGIFYTPNARLVGQKGTTLTTDSNGVLVGAFYIPPETFFVGDRSIIFSDIQDLDSIETSVSNATTKFNAYNFSKSTSSLGISTKAPDAYTLSTSSTQSSVSSIETRNTPRLPTPPAPAAGPGCCCFIAGTKITMADGSYKNIEDVELGDVVIGKDGSHNEVLEFLRPTLGDTGATMMAFNGGMPFMTSDHPVYVRGYGWKSFDPKMTEQKYFMPVGKYQVGDVIETPDGSGFEIKSIEEYSDQNQDQIIYNFRLGGNHTYIADGLVVHNKCFIAGTEVLLEDKTWKKIEDVGLDQILIGQDGSKNKILRLHRPKLGINDNWLPHKQRMVSINGSEFATSEDHMFFTTTGWKAPDAESCNLVHKHTIEAEGFVVTDLQLGDNIVTDDGRLVKVVSIEFRDDDPELQLYNFWTDGNHTYHVKMKDSQDGMLVHNKCFIAGTQVLLADGTSKDIADIELGDVLLGHSGSSNEVVEDHSQPISTRDRQPIWYGFNGNGGFVTAAHPILTEKGWRAVDVAEVKRLEILPDEDVQQLEVGDVMLCKDGESVMINSIEEYHTSPDDIGYNHGLTGDHTYFVRMPGTDKWLIAHNRDPLSQTFSIDREDGSDGVFLTKVDLYFKQKDPLLGVNIQIRETDNGYPSANILARKFVPSSLINVSNTAATATTVTFNTPIYLKSLRDYCIVIEPDQFNPNYLMWTAEAGEPDVANTNLKTNTNWGGGVLFASSNDKAWTAIQGEDLKFKVYIANFSKTNATIAFENGPYEFLTVSNTSGSFIEREEVGQKSNTYLSGTFTCNTTSAVVNTSTSQVGTLSAGDYVLIVYGNTAVIKTGTVTVGNTSTTNVTGSGTSCNTEYSAGDYILINGELREVVSTANTTQLTIDAPLSAAVNAVVHSSVTNAFQVSRVNNSNSSTITLKDYPLYKIDGGTTYHGAVQKVVRATVDRLNSDGTMVLSDSNASNSTFLFQAGKTIVGDESKATATITTVDNKIVNYTEAHLLDISPPTASVSIIQKIQSNTVTAANSSLMPGISNPVKYEGLLRSRSNEITTGAKSLQVYANLTRANTFTSISPIVDTVPASIVTLTNLINNTSAGETTRYGNSQVKYISKNVVLADGLDAEDMKVYLTAYKPSTSNILVYAKILASDDTSVFEDRDWTLLQQTTEAGLYSDSLNESDFIEYEYGFNRTPPSTAITGVITSSGNTTITGSGTSFSSVLAANDVIKVVDTNTNTDYDIAIVDAVANNTQLTLKSNTSFTSVTASIEKVTQKTAAFKYNRDGSVVNYFDSSLGLHSKYKIYAIKVVLLSSSSKIIPIVSDVRAIAVSI
jgi:hypothetical protein